MAKICQNYGQRVQNSVFECVVEPAQLFELKSKLLREIDPNNDSLRYYRLGSNPAGRIEHIGVKRSFDIEHDALIL